MSHHPCLSAELARLHQTDLLSEAAAERLAAQVARGHQSSLAAMAAGGARSRPALIGQFGTLLARFNRDVTAA